MKSQVLEKIRTQRIQTLRKRGILGLLRIGALLERQSELDLSEDQMKKLLAIRSDMIRSKAKLTGDIRVARLELVYYVAANIGDVSTDQVRSSLKNIYTMRLERKALTLDAFKKAAAVLSDEQKDKLHDFAQEKLAEMEMTESDVFSEEEEE